MRQILIITVLFASLRIFSQTTSLQFDKDLHAYREIENPITVIVENTDCKSLVIRSKYGFITRDTINLCKFIYKPLRPDYDSITISKIDSKKDTIQVEKKIIYIKPLPIRGRFAYYQDGDEIDKNLLLLFPKSFKVSTFDIDVSVEFPVDSFTVKIIKKCNQIFKERYSIKDDMSKLINEFSKLEPCDEIEFIGISYYMKNEIHYINSRLRFKTKNYKP